MSERRKPPDEIEAQPWKDYVPTPDKRAREPFMAPGGWWALGSAVALIAAYYFTAKGFHGVIDPWIDRLFGNG